MSFDDSYKKEIDHIINDEFPWYIKLLEDCFDFKRWGFQMIYSGPIPNTHPTIVYESRICRVRFIWEVPTDFRDLTEMTWILYGRLHAPVFSPQRTMDWNGEKCYCWQSVDDALNFLDGLKPQEARKSSAFMSNFYQANKNKGWRPAEMGARRQAAVWEHYGQRLFDIFDSNRPDLWQQYTNFLKERYSIGVAYVDPFPLYKVC
jgi:hypothetical protein